jgi:hypothetical protein
LIILVLAVVIFGRDTILARLPQRLSELATGTATTAHQTTGGTSDIPVASEIPTTSQANSLSTKSAIMTDRDGNATVVPADTLRRCSSVNTTLYLDNGQSVLLGNVKRIDVTRSSSSNTLFAITLLDNTRIEGLASRCSFLGETSIGSFELWDEKLQSIVIESGNTQPSLQPSPTTTYKPLWQSRAVMTDRNGNGTEVPADTLRRCSGVNTTLNLDNGQSVSLDKVKRIDVVRSSSTNTLFAITLLDEIRLEGLVGRCSFLGETSAGRFELWDENLQRVEIFRE